MIAPCQLYPTEVDPHEEVLPVLREYFSLRPPAVSDEPGITARELRRLNFMKRQPSEAAVVAAIEALIVDGEVMA
jgi:hypothetical protein